MNVLQKQMRAIAMLYLITLSIAQAISQELKPLAQLVIKAKSEKGITRFRPFQQLTSRTAEVPQRFSKYLKAETIVQLNPSVSDKLFSDAYEVVALSIPFKNEMIELELVEQPTLAEGFVVRTSDAQNAVFDIEKPKFYRGIVKNDVTSAVALNIFDGEISGIISTEKEGNIVIGKVPNSENAREYLIYSDQDLLVNLDFHCDTDEMPHGKLPSSGLSARNVEGDKGPKTINIYIECDYNTFLKRDSSVREVVNYITGAFNNVATIYANEGISVAISELFIWTSPDPYPKTTSNAALSQFARDRPIINGDLGHLVTMGTGSMGGVAFVSGLCAPNLKYAFSNIANTYEQFPTYSWTVMVLAHEIGHNLGSQHTQWCGWPGGAIDNCARVEGSCSPGPAPVNGGTIMSYCMGSQFGVKFSNGFGKLPGDAIRAGVAQASCLGSYNRCFAPNAPTVSKTTSTTAHITWSSTSGAIEYRLDYSPINVNTWSTMYVSKTATVLTDLSPSTTYRFRISTVCGNDDTSSFTRLAYFTTPQSDLNYSCQLNDPPQLLSKTMKGVTLSWEVLKSASLYIVECVDASTSKSMTLTSKNNLITLNNLIANTTYNVSITPVCSNYKGSPSPSVTFTISRSERSFSDTGADNVKYSIAPNPTQGIVSLQIESATEGGDATVTVHDQTGKTLITEPSFSIISGWQSKDINLTDLPNGMYFIKVQNNQSVAVRKVLLMRQ